MRHLKLWSVLVLNVLSFTSLTVLSHVQLCKSVVKVTMQVSTKAQNVTVHYIKPII